MLAEVGSSGEEVCKESLPVVVCWLIIVGNLKLRLRNSNSENLNLVLSPFKIACIVL